MPINTLRATKDEIQETVLEPAVLTPEKTQVGDTPPVKTETASSATSTPTVLNSIDSGVNAPDTEIIPTPTDTTTTDTSSPLSPTSPSTTAPIVSQAALEPIGDNYVGPKSRYVWQIDGEERRTTPVKTPEQLASDAAQAEIYKVEQERLTTEAEALAKAKRLASENLRKVMTGNLEDPNTFLEERDLLQKYTADNSYLKNPDGTLLLDANGKPQEDISLSMDARYYQLQAARSAELVKAGIATAQEVEAVAVQNFEEGLLTVTGMSSNLTKIAALEPMKAASMSEKLNGLLEGMEEGNIPLWARPAVTKVEQSLSGRGISASSIGRDSLFNAIIQAAMPIAQQDATFEQDASKTVYTSKVQGIIEDTKIEFAAKQFNAKSANDATQFKAQLSAQIDSQNADRAARLSEYNATALNSGEQFNANQANELEKFSLNLQTQREQFNVNARSQIDSATIQWRRQMNSANTAGINAVNQANVQQAFNLSNQALSNLWQEQRDEAQWMFTATQNEKDRKANLDAAVLARESSTASEIGGFIEGLDINYSDVKAGVTTAWDWVSGYLSDDSSDNDDASDLADVSDILGDLLGD